MAIAAHPPDRGVGEKLDVGRLLDPMDQIAGHVLVQIIAADQEEHLAGMLGKKGCSLAGGVAATHQHHLCPSAHLALGEGRRVVDTLPLEQLAPLYVQPAIVGSSGNQQALRGYGLTGLQSRDGVGLLPAQVHGLSGDRQAGTELVGLEDSALRQLGARHAGGKAEIVLDPHAAARLAAGRNALQQHRPQSFRGRIDRGGQPGRAGTHHDQVVDRLLHRLMNADRIGQLPV